MKYLRKMFTKLLAVRSNFLPVLILIFCSLIFFYPAIFQNKIPLPTDALVGAHIPWTEYRWPEYPAGVPIKSQEITDAVSQFYPWRALVGSFWRSGKPPLWNYYMFNGAPFLATLHSAALYPLNFIYLFLSDASAWAVLVYLQIILSMWFMYLLLREINLPRLPSVLGSIAFGFSGYMIAWLQFATGGHAGLWLPLILYFVLRFKKTENIKYLFPIPFIFFMVFTAGDFQVPLYVSATYLLFNIFIFLKRKDFVKKILQSLVFFGIGILLALPQLLPTYELFRNSVRFDDPYIRQYYFGLMNWEKLSQFLWPDFFGNIVTRNYWGKFGFHEYMCYVGIIGIVFVIYSFLHKKVRMEMFFWIILILSLLFLFPTPIAFLPYKLHIPALGTSSASRVIFLTDFSLSVLIAFGFNKYINSRKSLSKIVFYLLVVSIGLGTGFAISLIIMNDPITPVTVWIQNIRVTLKNMIPGTVLLLLLAVIDKILLTKKFGLVKRKNFTQLIYALIVFIFFADMLRFGLKNRPFSEKKFLFPVIPVIEYLLNQPGNFRIGGGLPTNYPMAFKLESVEGYDPIYPKINSDFYSIVDWGDNSKNTGRYGLVHQFGSPLLNYAGMKYVMDYLKDDRMQINDDGKLYQGVEEPKFKEVYYDRRVYIFENTESLPYIWLRTDYEISTDEKVIISKLLSSKEGVIILEKSPRFESYTNPEFEYNVEDVEKGLNTINFSVYSKGDSLAFISESFNTGWIAYIDGNRTEILKANHLFQAIHLPSGRHQITLRYNPISFTLGAEASILTLSGYGIFMISTMKKKITLSRKGNGHN